MSPVFFKAQSLTVNENWVRGHSRSLELTPLDRMHMTSC